MKSFFNDTPHSTPSDPLSRVRINFLFVFFVAGFIYITTGLAYRQLVQASEIMIQSDNQIKRVVIRPPARGKIYDRHGYTIVDNRVRWSVKADLLSLQPEFRQEYLSLIRKAKADPTVPKINYDALNEQARLNVLNGWLDKIWFVIDANTDKPKKLKTVAKLPSNKEERTVNRLALRKHLTESRALKFTLITDLAFPGSENASDPDEANRTVARFIEQFPQGGPISLESDMVRSYPYSTMAAHVLGYVRDSTDLPPNVDDFTDLNFDNLQKLRYTGKRGAAGIEQTFDPILSGASGWELWTKTSSGYNKELLRSSEPRQGSSINLSLDINIQLAAEEALRQIKDSTGNPLPGAAVMLDVNTGEILAMASQPTFDPNRLVDRISNKYYDEIENQGGWLNRATQGQYAPGSTFKIITAIAGMRNHIIDWDDILECGTSFRVGNRDFPEHGGEAFGSVDVEKMLTISSNVWNYRVGLKLGPELLAKEARRFGLDAPLLRMPPSLTNPSTTELPYPTNRLVIPDPAYKMRIGAGPWNSGDTANMSIGQGYTLTTPLHMACLAASVARNETRTTPTIIHDPNRDGRHEGAVSIGLNKDQLEAIRIGMKRCVEVGTARSMQIEGLSIAAKTGTSEYFKNGEKAHLAWVIGYAPADNPAVAFAVLIEGQLDTSTWGGKTAGPVAKAMLEGWQVENDKD